MNQRSKKILRVTHEAVARDARSLKRFNHNRFYTQALDRNFVKILFFIKCQSVLFLPVKFQVDRPGNKEATIYPTALS